MTAFISIIGKGLGCVNPQNLCKSTQFQIVAKIICVQNAGRSSPYTRIGVDLHVAIGDVGSCVENEAA